VDALWSDCLSRLLDRPGNFYTADFSVNPRDQIKYRYRVNREDVLTWVDSWWLAFARENGAPELSAQNVMGRQLWDFLDDEATRGIYQQLHHRVRASGQSVVVPFRCDSPNLRRHMRLTICPGEEGDLLYESQLLRVEAGVHYRVLDPEEPRGKSFLTICSCCKRALLETHGWLEMDEAVLRSGIFDRKRLPQLRYSFCDECREAAISCVD
jgi:hypothetical protein